MLRPDWKIGAGVRLSWMGQRLSLFPKGGCTLRDKNRPRKIFSASRSASFALPCAVPWSGAPKSAAWRGRASVRAGQASTALKVGQPIEITVRFGRRSVGVVSTL